MSAVVPLESPLHVCQETGHHVLKLSPTTPPATLTNNFGHGVRRAPYFLFGGIYPTNYTPLFGGAPLTLVAPGDFVAPITWEVTSGSIPSGMTLSSDGIFSGTPTEQFDIGDCSLPRPITPYSWKHYTFRVRATDSDGRIGVQNVDFPVGLGARYQISFTLPTGASLSANNVVINGLDDVGIVLPNLEGVFVLNRVVRLEDGSNPGGALSAGSSPTEDLSVSGHTGLGSWRQSDGVWTAAVTLGIKFGDTWDGVMQYIGEPDTLCTSQVLSVSRYDPPDPPAIDGSLSLTLT